MFPVPAELCWETETPPRGTVLDCSQSLPLGNMLLQYPRKPGTYPILSSSSPQADVNKRHVYKDGLKSLIQEVITISFTLPKTPGEQALGRPQPMGELEWCPWGCWKKDIGPVLLES